MQSQGYLPESTSHPGPTQCDSQQTVQTSAGHSDRMIPAPGGLCSDLSQVAPSQSGLVRDQVQLQAASVRVPSRRCKSLGSGCSEPILGESGPVCVPPNSSPDKRGHQGSQSSVSKSKDDSHSSGLAKHALVLGSGGVIVPDTVMPAKPAGSPNPAVQWQPTQGSTEPESPCLAHRAKAIRNRVSLTRWQQELKHLRDSLLDLSMKQSGPFLFIGARRIR